MNNSRVIKFILHLLKICTCGNKFSLGAEQLAAVEKAAGVCADTGENSFDIEQVLHSALSLATQAGIDSVGTKAKTDASANGNEYAKQQDTQENARDR